MLKHTAMKHRIFSEQTFLSLSQIRDDKFD